MRVILIIMTALLIAGCSAHTGPQITHAQLDSIKVGKTTKQEVIAMFGELPSHQSRTAQNTTLTWRHTRTDPFTYMGVYFPDEVDTLTVIFDADDVVKDFSFSNYQRKRESYFGDAKGPGLGVQQ